MSSSPVRLLRCALAALVVLTTVAVPVLTPRAASAAEYWRGGPVSASAHAASAALGDGRVLFLGGTGAPEIFTPVMNTFSPAPPPPVTLLRPVGAVTLRDGTVLTAGGRHTTYGEAVADSLLFEPRTNTWRRTLPLTQPTLYGQMIPLPDGGALLVDASSGSSGERTERYDPLLGAWTPAGSTTYDYGWTGTLLALPGGDALIVGGDSTGPRAERWSRLTRTWRVVAAPRLQVFRAAGIALRDGDVLVAGGFNQVRTGANELGVALRYDPDTDQWRDAGALVQLPQSLPALRLLDDGRAVLVGGEPAAFVEDPASLEAELFDPATDLWSTHGRPTEQFLGARLDRLSTGEWLLTGASKPASNIYTPPASATQPQRAAGGRPVRLEQSVSSTPARTGRPVSVVGHLVDVATGDPVAGEPVTLYARPKSSGSWTHVATAETDPSGAAAFAPVPREPTVYALRHPATTTAGQAAGRDALVTPVAAGRPGPPEAVAAAPRDGALEVSWTAPDDDGGSPITSYEVTVAGVTRTVGPDVSRLVVTGLQNGTSYNALVGAVSASGAGAAGLAVEMPQAGARTPSGTPLCGRIADRATVLTAAASPYRVCAAGVVLSHGAALTLDASAGAIALARERGGLRLQGADLRTTGTAAGRGATIDGGAAPAVSALDRVMAGTTAANTISLSHLSVHGGLQAIDASRALRLRLADSSLQSLSGTAVSSVATPTRVERSSVTGSFGDGVRIECPGSCEATVRQSTFARISGSAVRISGSQDVQLQDVDVTDSGTRDEGGLATAAVVLDRVRASVGPGQDVSGLSGSSNPVNGIALSGTITSDLTWSSPAASSTRVPLGYLLGELVMAPGTALTLPAGAVVRAGNHRCSGRFGGWAGCYGKLTIGPGAVLQAAGTGATMSSSARPTAGVACPSALAPVCTPERSDWDGVVVETGGRLALTGAVLRDAVTAVSGNGAALTLDAVTVADSRSGVSAAGGTTTITNSTLRDLGTPGFDPPWGSGVSVRGTLTVAGSRFENILGSGLGVDAAAVQVTDTTFDRITELALSIANSRHPILDRITITRSGRGTSGTRTLPAARIVDSEFSVGPTGDLRALSGGGNGVDAIGLNGYVTADLAWSTPRNSDAIHPLGHYIARSPNTSSPVRVEPSEPMLVLRPTSTLTVAAGGIVKAEDESPWDPPALSLKAASLDATAGGALFTGTTDATAGYPCVHPCQGHRAWGGLRTSDSGGSGGALRLHRGEMRGGILSTGEPRSDGARFSGTIEILDSTLSRVGVDIYDSGSTSLVGTVGDGSYLSVAGTGRVRLERNSLRAAPHVGISVTGLGRDVQADYVVRDNVIEVSGAKFRGPAMLLRSARLSFGVAGAVHGNRGGGNRYDAISLSDVAVDGELVWRNVDASSVTRPLGYLAGMPGPSSTNHPALTVGKGARLVVPEGGILKASSEIYVHGGALEATGAVLTSMDDGTVGPDTCPPEPGTHPTCGWPSIRGGPAGDGSAMGSVDLIGSDVRMPVWVADGRGKPATDPDSGLSIGHSRTRGVHVDGAVGRLRHVRAVGAVVLRSSDPVEVHELRGDSPRETALTVAAGSALLDRIDVVGAGTEAQAPFTRPAMSVTGEVTLRCADVRGSVGGVTSHGTRLTVQDSNLTGNSGTGSYGQQYYDADNWGPLRTTGVWWGQPPGPLPGQVRAPLQHLDVSPAAGPVACAGAAPVVPPTAPAVTASQDADDIVLSWQPPADDGGSSIVGYRVWSTAGDVVEASADVRSLRLPLRAGEQHTFVVRALSAAALTSPPGSASASRLPPPPSSPSPSPGTAIPAPSASSAPVSPAPLSPAPVSPTPTPASSPSPVAGGGGGASDPAPPRLVSPTPSPSPSPTPPTTPPPGPAPGQSPAPDPGERAAPAPERADGVTRFAGSDRFGTAAAASRGSFPGTADDVFIVTGTNWPDALSAGPAAAAVDAPVLPVLTRSIPKPIAEEIARLRPARAWVIGGATAVDDTVVTSLRARGISVTRISGRDRYATAAALAARFFPAAQGAYYASGGGYADALAGGAAAAARGWPLLLTSRQSVPAGTPKVGTERVVLGGPHVVSEAVRVELRARRVAGSDRYATAAAIALDAFPRSRVGYLATGLNFPDALAGSPAAARDQAPLLLAATDCVTSATRDAFRTLGVTARVVLGGPAVVTDRAAQLEACR